MTRYLINIYHDYKMLFNPTNIDPEMWILVNERMSELKKKERKKKTLARHTDVSKRENRKNENALT